MPFVSSALLVLDMMNDLVHPDGKLGARFAGQVAKRDVLSNTARAIERARRNGFPVIFVVIGFTPGFEEFPPCSPLLSEPPENRPMLGTWGTQVHDAIKPEPGESVVVKHRVSPFYATSLEMLLRKRNIDTVLLAGVSTDLVVLSTARDAHDRDYRVTVLSDASAAHTQRLHTTALTLIGHTADVSTVDEALPDEA
jgi:nicotinamidase-related amidase